VIFISPVAAGADTLFANIALEYFSGTLQIYLPFETEEYIKDFKSTYEIAQFERLISEPKVKSVICLNNLSDNNRNELYLKVGQKVIDESDYIIAVWDQEQAAGTGGTGDVAAYAIKQNKNLLVINPAEDELTIRANYLPHLSECINDVPRPDTFSKNIVEDYFNLFDRVAIHNQFAFKRIWAGCFGIGGLGAALIMTIKICFNLSEDAQFILTIIEIICLSIVLGLIIRERRKAFHKNYLLYRFIAERLRINNLLYKCGYYPIKTVTRVIHKAMQEIESKYPVNLINKIIVLTSYSGHSFDEKKILVNSFAKSQAKYHHWRKLRLEKKNKQNHYIKIACLAGFALIILYHVLNEFSWNSLSEISWENLKNHPKEPSSFLKQVSFFFYLFIPTILARFEAVKYLNDWERLITQSRYMEDFFSEISEKVDRINDEKELHELLIDLNDNIYLENLDWEMFMVNKNEEIT
jgi:hypothetical protein